jgi:rhamnogalacturonyl hydrolase YesR
MMKYRSFMAMVAATSWLSVFGSTVYTQNFNNPGGDTNLSSFGWSALGNSDASGLNEDVSDEAKGVGVAPGDYVFFAPQVSRTLNCNGVLAYTTDSRVQVDVSSIAGVSYAYSGDPVDAVYRVAIRVDGLWYAQALGTTDSRNNPGGGAFISTSFEPASFASVTNWLVVQNAAVGAGPMTLGAAPVRDLAGTVTAIGLFMDATSTEDHVRFTAFRMMDASEEHSDDDPIVAAMMKVKEFQERRGKMAFDWANGMFYSGVMACYKVTGDKEFLDAARDWCASGNWTCAVNEPMHADYICTAQTFLDVYAVDKDPKQIEQINGLFEKYYFDSDTLQHNLMGHVIWTEPTRPFIGRNIWWWCDALYMVPPLMARLGKATGNQQYYELLHKLYWDAAEYLYNKEEHLFFRDHRYFDSKTPSGQPMFWSRGNGWVIGGLVRTLDYLPEEDPLRPKYIKLFQEMMARIVTLQGDDGLWRSSLNEPEWFPMPESSGSSFFTFGLAAGINRGWLDWETYLPYAKKGWGGLLSCLNEEGMVEWSQPVAENPYATKQGDTRSYTQGAFLLAASEMYKLERVEQTGTFCRYVPERIDDFAWENDKIAFRAYGPKARPGAENSGIDCWLKRVEYPIINKWYGQMNTRSYHMDWGEGYDPYHVGSTAGCGGTGIWIEGRREPLETYTKHEVIECTPKRSRFKLTYEREIGGVVYGEEKTITIEPGKRLFDVHSVFTKNGKIASGLPVCIGVTTHNGSASSFSDEKRGWIACWEKIDDSELGTAAMADPKRIDEIKEVKSEQQDESHIFILMKTDRKGSIDYQAGYGWKKAGEIKTSNEWKNYLNNME